MISGGNRLINLRPFIAILLLWFADQASAQTDSPAERVFSLKGIPENPDIFSKFGDGAMQHVRFEPEGLRITLPAGFPGERPFTGLRIDTPLKGDFTVTVNFELLQEPRIEDVGAGATRAVLTAHLNAPGGGHAAIARRMAAKGGTQFSAYVVGGGFKAFPTDAKRGRLRMIRTGSDMSFFKAEGTENIFTYLHRLPFKAHDLMNIELAGVTSSPDAALDIRFSDLRIRAGNSVDTIPPPAPERQNGWTIVLMLLIVLALLSGLVLALWLSRRGRDANKAAADDLE